MRVGLYSHTPLEHYGGGEVTLIALANWLADRGDQVEVRVEDAYTGPRRLASEEVRRLLDARVGYRPIPFQDRKWAGFPSIWRSTLPVPAKLREDDASLLLLPTVPDRRYLLELIAQGTRAMFLLHALTVDQPFPLRRKILWDEMVHRLSLYSVRGLPPSPRLFYQVLNDRSAGLLRWHGVPPGQVRLIPTGIDFSRYRVADDEGQFRVAFVGRIHDPWKGIDRLRRTVRRTLATSPGPVDFVLMGSGPDAGALRSWAARAPHVRYLGFVPFEQKVAELSRCSALLSTSGSEPYGLGSLEGFASGLPLVATPTAGSSYLVRQDPRFGLVRSYSGRELARALLGYRSAWSADRPGYAAARLDRRQRAFALFDLPKMFARYDLALDELSQAG